jgi:hypothetical protein
MDILHTLVEIAKLTSADWHNAKRGAPFEAPRFAAIIQCLVRPMRLFACYDLSISSAFLVLAARTPVVLTFELAT